MEESLKQLLLKDLCARLPYGLKGTVEIEVSTGEYSIESGHLLFIEKEIDVELLGINKETEEIEVCPLNYNIDISEYDYTIDDFIPYLRPMSSMTEEEHEWYVASIEYIKILKDPLFRINELINWLLKNHFDYSGLIEQGLALKAPEDMYGKEE